MTTKVTCMEYTRAIVKAADEISASLLGEVPRHGSPTYQVGHALDLQEVTVGIGLTGGLSGHVTIGMDVKTALAVAETMIGEPVEELDEVALSSLSELLKIVSGAARTYLKGDGVIAEMTPPAVMMGNKMSGSWHQIRAMTVPLKLSFGTLYLMVGIKKGV